MNRYAEILISVILKFIGLSFVNLLIFLIGLGLLYPILYLTKLLFVSYNWSIVSDTQLYGFIYIVSIIDLFIIYILNTTTLVILDFIKKNLRKEIKDKKEKIEKIII